jgi:hypothetical protein
MEDDGKVLTKNSKLGIDWRIGEKDEDCRLGIGVM